MVKVTLVLCAIITSFTTYAAQSSVIGAVYPIEERNALEAIREKAAQVDWRKAMSNYTQSWLERQQMELPNAEQDAVRFHKPIHRLEREIADGQGRVIYPQGFEFNPLDFMTMPFRIIVIRFDQIEWLKGKLKKTDRVLLTSGDIFKARQLLDHPMFLLDAKTRKKLSVLRVPTIVKQKGNMFELEEHKIDQNIAAEVVDEKVN